MKQLLKEIVIYLLTAEAKLVLRKYHPHIIAVTGSVGKTSTKDAIYTVLCEHVHTRKSEKSFNSEIGVPLTILGLPNAWSNPLLWCKNLLDGLLLLVFKQEYPDWLVLEVGADRPGDIEKVSMWLTPDIVVLTRFPDVPVHVEFFSSPEEVIREKLFLARALRNGGTIIINADDDRICDLQVENGATLKYGFGTRAEVHGTHERVIYEYERPVGMHMKIEHNKKSISVELKGVLGRHHLYPLLAAFAVSVVMQFNPIDVGKELSGHTTPPGRMKLLRGKNGCTIIDDTYNASPIAMEEALTALSLVQIKGRKIAALGDMLELGQYTKAMHEEAGTRTARVVDHLYTVGIRAQALAKAALEAGMKKEQVMMLNDAGTLGELLVSLVQDGDVVLVKGSQSMRMERTVEALLEDPSRKRELLVRQDDEWEKR